MDEYVLVTAARNEERYLEKTIASVAAQTVRPKRWVIVNDGSSDHSADIIAEQASRYGFIRAVAVKGNGQRSFSSKVFAIRRGLSELEDIEYSFIGNLDADIILLPDFYEMLIARFGRQDELGIAGGWIYERCSRAWKVRPRNSQTSVPGSIQLFRRACFEQIDGYLPLPWGGEDSIAEVMARMRGWATRSFSELAVYHSKSPQGNFKGLLAACYRQGREDYFIGYHPLFELLKCLGRFQTRPIGMGTVAGVVGFASAYARHQRLQVPREVVKYLRAEQMRRIGSVLGQRPNRIEWLQNRINN